MILGSEIERCSGFVYIVFLVNWYSTIGDAFTMVGVEVDEYVITCLNFSHNMVDGVRGWDHPCDWWFVS